MEVNHVEINGKIKHKMECPLISVHGDKCSLNKRIKCRFGLTEVVVPKKCPLKKGPIKFTYKLLTEVLTE